MKKYLISDALSEIDEDILENHFIYKEALKSKSSISLLKIFSSLTACLVIVISSIFMINIIDKSGNLGADAAPGDNNTTGDNGDNWGLDGIGGSSGGQTTSKTDFLIGEAYEAQYNGGEIQSFAVNNFYLTRKIGNNDGYFVVASYSVHNIYYGISFEDLYLNIYPGGKRISATEKEEKIIAELNGFEIDDFYLDLIKGDFFFVYSIEESDFELLKNQTDGKAYDDMNENRQIEFCIYTGFNKKHCLKFHCSSKELKYIEVFN